MIIEVGNNTLDCDVEATKAAYEAYAPHVCDCCGCRNFRVARGHAFTEPVVGFFIQFGIDTTKPHECYDIGPLSPEMLCAYGGWFHFIGEAISDEEVVDISENVKVFFAKGGARPPQSFLGQPCVQLEFELKIPWLVPDPWGSDRRPAKLAL